MSEPGSGSVTTCTSLGLVQLWFHCTTPCIVLLLYS